MKIGILSDTHSFLDPKILEYFKDVDEIWHAGDIGNPKVVEQLAEFKPLVAVYGNIDNNVTRIDYPEFQRFERESAQILMTHIAGKPGKYARPLHQEILANGSPDIFVCGHSHLLLVKKDPHFNMLWINPGAAGKHGFHHVRTIIRFEINQGKAENMEVIELGLRAKI